MERKEADANAVQKTFLEYYAHVRKIKDLPYTSKRDAKRFQVVKSRLNRLGPSNVVAQKLVTWDW